MGFFTKQGVPYVQKEADYHPLAFVPDSNKVAFVPDSNKVLILSKACASTKTDEKTRNHTSLGEGPKKQEYLVILELTFMKSDNMKGKHNLGLFTQLENLIVLDMF